MLRVSPDQRRLFVSPTLNWSFRRPESWTRRLVTRRDNKSTDTWVLTQITNGATSTGSLQTTLFTN